MRVDIPTKPAGSSLTIWFNVATVALVILGALIDNAANLGIPPVVLGYVAVASGIINTLLRIYKTSLPIGPEGGVKAVAIDPPDTVR